MDDHWSVISDTGSPTAAYRLYEYWVAVVFYENSCRPKLRMNLLRWKYRYAFSSSFPLNRYLLSIYNSHSRDHHILAFRRNICRVKRNNYSSFFKVWPSLKNLLNKARVFLQITWKTRLRASADIKMNRWIYLMNYSSVHYHVHRSERVSFPSNFEENSCFFQKDSYSEGQT